jgi:hypothetical protein
MRMRTRKLIGSVLLLIFVLSYVFGAAAVGSGRLAEAGAVTRLLYYLLAGLLWVYPAGLLVRWMQRPDTDSDAG